MTIGADDMTWMNVFIDAAYAVHPDMKSHTGGCIFFGRGAIMSKATKQKLNTCSSTEAELVGNSDFIPSAIYASLFLNAQGYDMQPSTVNQDNQSTMKLLTNGRASCSTKSRHIDIRYFFMKDRIDKGEFTVQYCPTELMIADFFSKPLQGSLFQRFSAVIMGEVDLITFLNSKPPPSKERVGVSNDTDSTDDSDVITQPTYADVAKRNTTNSINK